MGGIRSWALHRTSLWASALSCGCQPHRNLATQSGRPGTEPQQHLVPVRYLRTVGAAYQRFEANRSAADADSAERRVSVAELAAGGSSDRQAPGEGLVAAMAAVPSLYFQEHFSLSRRAEPTSRSRCKCILPSPLAQGTVCKDEASMHPAWPRCTAVCSAVFEIGAGAHSTAHTEAVPAAISLTAAGRGLRPSCDCDRMPLT